MGTYIGWCPSITGRLSFNSLCAWANTASPLHTAIEPAQPVTLAAGDAGRLVVAHHDRASNDDPLLATIRASFGMIGLRRFALRRLASDRFDFFFVARAISDGADEAYLEGEVAVLFDADESYLWRSHLRGLISKLREFRVRDLSEINRIHTEFQNTLSQLKLTTRAQSPFTEPYILARVRLYRNGETRIELQPLPAAPPANTVLLAPAKVRRAVRNRHATYMIQLAERERANLVFRFVRDLFHSHYHHDINNDSITQVYDERSVPDWRSLTERALYRTVISARRGTSTAQMATAIGRLAYLKIFRSMFALYPSAQPLPTRELDPLAQSIEATIDAAQSREANWRVVITGIFVIPFAILGILVAAVQAFQGGPGTPLLAVESGLRHVYSIVTSNAALLTVVVGGTIFVYFFLIYLRLPHRTGVEREVHRWSVSLRTQQHAAAAQALGSTAAGPPQAQPAPTTARTAPSINSRRLYYATAIMAFGSLIFFGFLVWFAARGMLNASQVASLELRTPFSDDVGKGVRILAANAHDYREFSDPAPELRVECWRKSVAVAIRFGGASGGEPTTISTRFDRMRPQRGRWQPGANNFLLLPPSEVDAFLEDLIGANSLVAASETRGPVTFNVGAARDRVLLLRGGCS